MQNIKRNYKDTVFCDLFSDKENALSLYNALNKTDYTNVEDLEIVTLSEVIYMHQKNDVSILPIILTESYKPRESIYMERSWSRFRRLITMCFTTGERKVRRYKN